MSNTRKMTRPQATEYKRAPNVTVGMSIQQESILYGRSGRPTRRYY
jgi:hypothetical protein